MRGTESLPFPQLSAERPFHGFFNGQPETASFHRREVHEVYGRALGLFPRRLRLRAGTTYQRRARPARPVATNDALASRLGKARKRAAAAELRRIRDVARSLPEASRAAFHAR